MAGSVDVGQDLVDTLGGCCLVQGETAVRADCLRLQHLLHTAD
jgi:hypothetical protein